MKSQPQTAQSSNGRRIARRRFVALATPVLVIALLLSTSVASQATSLATTVLRSANIVSDGPALAGNHVAHQRRPASLNRHRAVTHPPQASFPTEWTPPQAPVGSAPTAVAPAASNAPANTETPKEKPAPPEEEEVLSPPVEPGPPVVEPTPPPKTEPEPPPKGEPEPPPQSEPEPPPPSEPEPPKVEPNEPVPEEPETETPSPPTADSIFTGIKIDDFALIESAPNAITEVPDPLGSGQTVLKLTVSDKDVAPITPTENPRAQALSPDIIHPGDEFWLSTKFLLPDGFPSNIPGWVGLGSIYGEPFNGPSPWQLDIEGEHINWPRNSTYQWDVPWQMPIVTGQWITVLLHERFAADGWVEMWVNGQPITFFSSGSSYNPNQIAPTEHLTMQTMDKSNNGGANSAKIANYREVGMFDSLTVYFGALRVGRTRASVGG
jgi:hypothetical protein